MRWFGMPLIVMGFLLIVTGIVFLFADRLPMLGRLPGDVNFRNGNVSFSFPIGTCVLLSIVLTVILNLLLHFLRK